MIFSVGKVTFRDHLPTGAFHVRTPFPRYRNDGYGNRRSNIGFSCQQGKGFIWSKNSPFKKPGRSSRAGPRNRICPFLKHFPSLSAPIPKCISHSKSSELFSVILYSPILYIETFLWVPFFTNEVSLSLYGLGDRDTLGQERILRNIWLDDFSVSRSSGMGHSS